MNHSELCSTDCNPFSEWLSASIDGELDARELTMLREHLSGCPACEALLDDLQVVDDVTIDAICFSAAPTQDLKTKLASSSNNNGTPSLQTIARHGQAKPNTDMEFSKPSRRRGWQYLAKRLVPVAIAASMLIGFFVVSDWGPPKLGAGEVVEQFEQVNEINVQQLRDQQRLKEFMELELRVLRLEVLSIDNREVANSFADKIESLLLKIKQID